MTASESADHRALNAILTKVFCKDPQRRFQTASAFAAELRRVIAREAIETRRPKWNEGMDRNLGSRRNAPAAAAAMVGLTLLSIVWLSASTNAPPRDAKADAIRDDLRHRLLASHAEEADRAIVDGDLAAAANIVWADFVQMPDAPQTRDALQTLFAAQIPQASAPSLLRARAYVDGRLLSATISSDQRLAVSDAETDQILFSGAPDVGAVRTLRFIHGGTQLLVTGERGVVSVNVEHQSMEHVVGGSNLVDADGADDGKAIYTIDATGVVQQWMRRSAACKCPNRQRHRRKRALHPRRPVCRGDLRQSLGKAVRHAGGLNLVVFAEWPAASGAMRVMGFNPDGTLLGLLNDRQALRIWDIAAQKSLASQGGKSEAVSQ